MTAICPLQCRLRRGAAPPDQVDWAGLPVNLDLAFSREQRDKVYSQHLIRKRATQLRRWNCGLAQVCVCQIEPVDPDANASESTR
ncbi:hypothetical protein [Mycobacterium simiae]|uniref:hypothetical protein n=1 Tax=Mycobacterium simiae TaxID=1784 RepID=UPI0021CDAD15|nr:hypothetical protein [Mycobacterium simiae]